MSDWSYTFQEFSDHQAALRYVLDYEHVEMGGELVKVGKPHSHIGVVLRMRDYLRDLHPEPQVWFYKLARFMFIMGFAATHRDTLEIPEGCLNGLELLRAHAPTFRAIHHYYTVRSMPEHDPTVEQVMTLAQKFRGDESAS